YVQQGLAVRALGGVLGDALLQEVLKLVRPLLALLQIRNALCRDQEQRQRQCQRNAEAGYRRLRTRRGGNSMYGGSPSAISITMMPRDQMSTCGSSDEETS